MRIMRRAWLWLCGAAVAGGLVLALVLLQGAGTPTGQTCRKADETAAGFASVGKPAVAPKTSSEPLPPPRLALERQPVPAPSSEPKPAAAAGAAPADSPGTAAAPLGQSRRLTTADLSRIRQLREKLGRAGRSANSVPRD
jgi:hypothetical protein